MSEIKVSADLTEAINSIASLLGLAANEIIPQYTKLVYVNGVAWVLGGLCMAVLPWVVFMIDITSPERFQYWAFFQSEAGWRMFWLFIRGGFCFLTTWGGLYTVFNYIENLFEPKGLAISKLLNQLNKK